jgi:hypothetical protein
MPGQSGDREVEALQLEKVWNGGMHRG